MDEAHPLDFLHTLFIDKLRELYRTSLVLFYLWFVGYLKFCKPYYCPSCIRIPYLQVGDESVCMTARIPERMWNCWKYKFSHKMKLPTKYGSYKIYVRKTNTERPKFICDLYRKSFMIDLATTITSLVIVKKSSPKNLSADCRSTVGRQVTDSLPTANQQVTDRLRKKKNCVKNKQLT